ncbi:polysaccharide pyruvyl transferase family protein [Geodermatophilus sp. SYSU D00758]
MRVLVAGWFSFDEVIATVGDQLGAATVTRWLTEAGVDHDVAEAPYLGSGVNWRDVDPADYTHLVFVSGPLSDSPLLRELSETFAGSRRWAVNVSVVSEAGRALFDEVWARDADGAARPDLAVEGPTPSAPVVGVAFTPAQGEYGDRSQADRVRGAIEEWLATRALPWFELSMDLFEKPHRRRPVQVEALIRRADVVVSMRLHALVLGVKHDRPVIACEPIAGGAKVTAQAGALGWPVVLAAEEVTGERLDAALEHCLSGQLAEPLREARDRGREADARTREWLTARLGR